MARNLWTVTTDHLGDKRDVSFGTYKGTSPETDLPIRFQLLDDDGELYYEGRMSTLDCDGDAAFAPLDWVESDGCTEMRIAKAGSTDFETL